jgi:hypothetical protein
VEGYFGVVMLVVVLIPFFINFSETNTFPSVIPLYIYVSALLMGLGFIWPSFLGGFDEVTCDKDFIVADVSYFPCAVQGKPIELRSQDEPPFMSGCLSRLKLVPCLQVPCCIGARRRLSCGGSTSACTS